jgi:Fe-S cluster biogenesis protein NfuA
MIFEVLEAIRSIQKKADPTEVKKGDEELENFRLSCLTLSPQADGGDVELVDVTEDGIVKVRLKGACGSCPMSTVTLKMGIERAMKDQIPAVKEVVQVP